MNAPQKLKTRKCNICKTPFLQFRTTQKVCSPKCAAEVARLKRVKEERIEQKRERQALREAKERIKTRQQWLKEAQSVFNRYIRLRDQHLPCISCSRFHQGQYHAGHYRTVGSAPELRFNEHNVWKQCAPCNNHLSGNIINYRINLIKKIGLEQVEWLEGKHEAKHYSIDEIKQLIAHYKAKCKELQKD